jgi:hypothetical protein
VFGLYIDIARGWEKRSETEIVKQIESKKKDISLSPFGKYL